MESKKEMSELKIHPEAKTRFDIWRSCNPENAQELWLPVAEAEKLLKTKDEECEAWQVRVDQEYEEKLKLKTEIAKVNQKWTEENDAHKVTFDEKERLEKAIADYDATQKNLRKESQKFEAENEKLISNLKLSEKMEFKHKQRKHELYERFVNLKSEKQKLEDLLVEKDEVIEAQGSSLERLETNLEQAKQISEERKEVVYEKERRINDLERQIEEAQNIAKAQPKTESTKGETA